MFQFTINAKELSAIQALDKIASTNTSAMHLQKMLVEVDENAVRLTTSNPEARMTATLHVAEIEGSGKILVEPKTLGALARAIGETPMKLTYNDGVDAVEISTPNGKYSLNAYDATDYPQVVSAAGTTYEVLAEDIARGIRATAFAAASNDDYRPFLQGVQMAFGASALTFSATDTHILAQLSVTDFAATETTSVIVSTKYAQTMAAICDDTLGKVSLTISEKSLTLNAGTIEFTTALVAGTYPDVNRVFPKEAKVEAEIDAAALRTTLSRVGILANDRVPCIHISINAIGKICVSTADKDTQQDAAETIYGTANNAVDMDFAYKALTRAISAFSDRIIMQATDAMHPALFIPAEETERTRYRVLAMPMRI